MANDTPTPIESNTNSTPSVQEAAAAAEAKTRRKTYPTWGYCTQYIEEGRKKIKCMYCNMVFKGGGIHRFKEHFAKWPGNVAACSKVNPEVEHTMHQNIKDWNDKKRKAQEDYEEGHPYGPEPIEVEEEACEVSNTGTAAPACLVAAAPNRGTKRGNIAAKRRTGAGFSPELYTESKIASKTGGFMKSPYNDSMKFSARPPNHSGKIKLQLFPIDESIQKIMQQERHNPYLELILAPQKKISSVVQHLNRKWGSSQCAKDELMLFPNDARVDIIASCAKWTLKDSCTAADVHVAVGSPSTFRLRYGWFGPNLKQQSSGPSLASVQSADKIIGIKPPDLVFSEQKHMAASSEFPSNSVTPSIVDNTNAVQPVDNQSKVAPLSWLDSISNISFGALLSEAVPSQDSKQSSSQNNPILQQIPVTCDSFDAAIASLIARQQASNQPKVSNPSLWEAEDTCHAFAFQNQASRRASNSVPGNSGAATTSSVLGAIPETDTDDDQQCAANGREREACTEPSALGSGVNAKPEISMHESTGDPENGSSFSGFLSGTDSLGLSGLFANSLDAFQNFCVS